MFPFSLEHKQTKHNKIASLRYCWRDLRMKSTESIVGRRKVSFEFLGWRSLFTLNWTGPNLTNFLLCATAIVQSHDCSEHGMLFSLYCNYDSFAFLMRFYYDVPAVNTILSRLIFHAVRIMLCLTFENLKTKSSVNETWKTKEQTENRSRFINHLARSANFIYIVVIYRKINRTYGKIYAKIK